METVLPTIWLFLIGFFLLYYAVFDGSDLGIGIISLFSKDGEETGALMASIGAVWHDNQTWLVLLGGMVFGAFPVFYSLVLSSLYIPILLMLFGLVFRGVAFEFRENSKRLKHFWELSFGIGSVLVTLAQGFGLGGLLGGLQIEGGRFAGNVWGWLTPYSVLVAAGVFFGYVMLGANYLILKTGGKIQEKSFRLSRTASLTTLAISAAVHVWTVIKYPFLLSKYLRFPECLPVWVLVSLAGVSFVLLLFSLKKRSEKSPFAFNAMLVLFSFAGLSAGMYPYMIPNVITAPVTVGAAAASPRTLLFMLVMTVILLPVILGYTTYKRMIFRGKVGQTGYRE